jgi:hypothetical protein
MEFLSADDRIKAESLIRYTRGRFVFKNGEKRLAKGDLVYSLIHGQFQIKLKAAWMLLHAIAPSYKR